MHHQFDGLVCDPPRGPLADRRREEAQRGQERRDRPRLLQSDPQRLDLVRHVDGAGGPTFEQPVPQGGGEVLGDWRRAAMAGTGR